MMLRISIAVIACLPLLASAQWTIPPTVTNAAGSWTNTPGGGVVVPGPNVEPDTVKPGPATESWRRHVGQTGDAHGGIVMTPTNAALTGWALRYSATGRPYYAPVQASDLVTGYATNLVWMGEIESTGYWNDANAAATNAGSRLPTKDELVAKVLTDPAWINDLYWSGTETTPGNAYLVVAHDFDGYTKGQAIDTSKDAGYWAQAVRTVITTNTALDTFNAHTEQTTVAHGGIMRSASNTGTDGQVLLLNGSTGRPYWGDPETGSAAQSLLTSGVARVNGRYVSTNYTVTVSNGTWDGSTAILSKTGSVTIAANVPLSRWEYDHTTANGIGLTDLIEAGTWETNAHGLITRGDVYTVMIQAAFVSGAPSPDGGFATEISVSNLAVWTWGAAPLTGSTNDFQGIVTEFDDPATELNPVNLRTMQAAIGAIDTTPRTWANYDANGAPNRIDGVNMGGRRVYLDSQWSILGSGRYCALSYNGKDIFYISMSNQLLSVSQIIPGDLIRINVATNGATSKPWIEWTSDLVAGNWMEITNATSTYPVKTNGTYLMTFSNVWTSAFFRAVQASSNVSALVTTVPIDARGGLTLGGVTKTNWQAILQPITNMTITSTTNLTIINSSITNLSQYNYTSNWISTNVNITNSIVGMTEMPATWDADLIGTNSLDIKLGGMRMLEFTTNGTHVLNGGLYLGGVARTNWPDLVPGPQGEQGPAGVATTNLTIIQNTITNLTIQNGTNIYNAVDDSKWPTNQPFVAYLIWTNAGANSTTTNAGLITAIINTNSGSASGGVTNHNQLSGVLGNGSEHLSTAEVSRIPSVWGSNTTAYLTAYGTNQSWQPVAVNYQNNLQVTWTHQTNFTYQGISTQSFTVPAGVNVMQCKAWGAGGGGGTGVGGNGGFAAGSISVNAEDIIYIIVGGGGNRGISAYTNNPGLGGWPGGGSCPTNCGINYIGAGGGGYSAVSINSITNYVLIAGGGGGASASYSAPSGYGGAGGGTTGGSGDVGNGTTAALGGSLSTPGSGGTLNGYPSYQGGNGLGMLGGSGVYNTSTTQYRGGGGGGGYFGGGAGCTMAVGNGGQGGGGGSCFGIYVERGNNSADESYSSSWGMGGSQSASGASGAVVLRYYYNIP